jgi:triacylglycerol lipase
MSALTTTLYLPAPLIQLLRRLFVVFSSISISSKRPISSSSSQGSIGDAPSPTFAVSPPDISPKEWSIISSLLSLPSFDLRGTLRWPSFMSSPKSSHIEPTEEKPFYEEKTRPPQPPKNESFPSPSPRKEPPRPVGSIHDLLSLPTLFDPIRKPRNPIVLCHGLYGFDVWGPSSFPRLQMHYWYALLVFRFPTPS